LYLTLNGQLYLHCISHLPVSYIYIVSHTYWSVILTLYLTLNGQLYLHCISHLPVSYIYILSHT